jgi:acetyltransferase-like isoleucine patch superfamily enzyme
VNTAASYSVAQAIEAGLLDVHPSVMIADGVRFIPVEDNGETRGPITIGANTIVREGVIICSGAHIGSNCVIGHNVIVRRDVRIGDDTVISHLVVLEREAQVGRNVRISALTHITGSTLIEDNVEIGARVVTINDNELRWRRGEIKLVPPTFRHGCRVGSGVTILSGVEIGSNTIVGAGAVVTRNLPPNVVAYGVPAYVMRELERDELFVAQGVESDPQEGNPS